LPPVRQFFVFFSAMLGGGGMNEKAVLEYRKMLDAERGKKLREAKKSKKKGKKKKKKKRSRKGSDSDSDSDSDMPGPTRSLKDKKKKKKKKKVGFMPVIFVLL